MNSNSDFINAFTAKRVSVKRISLLLCLALSASFMLSSCKSSGNLPSSLPSAANSEAPTFASESFAPESSENTMPSVTESPIETAPPTPSPVPTPVPQYVEPLFEETWYDDYVDPRSVRAQIVENPDDLTVLVNKYYTLTADYVPSDLVTAPYSYDQQLRSVASDAWVLMHDACLEATGVDVILRSGYRSFETQTSLFLNSASRRGTDFAVRKNAWEGRSEHQLGLAIDLVTPDHPELTDDFDQSTAGQWISEHCYEYGFIMRFGGGEHQLETGYAREAWHYRYVGVELATYLYENDMSLEVYYNLPQIMPGDE